VKPERLRTIAAVGMLVSGVTHVSQLGVYGSEAIAPAIAGAIYFVIGLFLLKPGRGVLWAGAILPAIGGVGGTIRFFFIHTNPFSAFHVLIDLVVVPICWYLLLRKQEAVQTYPDRASPT